MAIAQSFVIRMAMVVVCAAAATDRAAAREAPPPSAGPNQNSTPAEASTTDRVEAWNWREARDRLAEEGVRINLFYTDQYQAVVKGGLDTKSCGRNAASMDLIITLDLGKLNVMEDAEYLFHSQVTFGHGINLRTGSPLQVNDDADGDRGPYVVQTWLRKHFLDRGVSLMVGFLDFQTIFDRNAFSNSEDKQFMHQALDNNPLVPLNIGMGAALTIRPTPWYTLLLGVGDAQQIPYEGGITTAFHDEAWYRVFMEHDLHLRIPSKRGSLAGNYRVGTFYDPDPKRRFSRSDVARDTRSGDYGLYVSVDQMLYRESDADEQGLGVFGRFAYRSPENNTMSRFWSAGLQYKGLLPGRDKDVVGLAFLMRRSSHLYRRRVDWYFSDESAYEFYYAWHASDWLVVSPDVQYIDNPGARGDVGHTITAGVRMRMSF